MHTTGKQQHSSARAPGLGCVTSGTGVGSVRRLRRLYACGRARWRMTCTCRGARPPAPRRALRKLYWQGS